MNILVLQPGLFTTFIYPAKIHNIDGAGCFSYDNIKRISVISGMIALNFSKFSENMPKILKKSFSICAMVIIWIKCTKI